MKMKNFALVAGLVGVMGVAVYGASAYAQNSNAGGSQMNRNSGQRAVARQAAVNNDYAGWQKATNGTCANAGKVTPENFANFSEMHKLMTEGKYEEAQKIRTELGLTGGRGMMKAGGKGKMNGGRANFVDANNNGICDHIEKTTSTN